LLARNGFYAELYNSQFAIRETNGNGYHAKVTGSKPVDVPA
jgi:hypothetical protein